MDQTFAATPDAVIARLSLDREALETLCRAHGVSHLALFGSAVRDDFEPERSDLDFLVMIEAPTNAAYADRYFSLKEGLEQLAGRAVDLLTESSIENPYLRRRIMGEKVTLYAA
jgi:predicted nucleotidyltransferase